MKTKITQDNRPDLNSLNKEEENQLINGLNTNFSQERYKKLSKEIKQLEKKLLTLQVKRAELREVCPHTNVTAREKNYEAGYDYTSTHIKQTLCSDCGKILNEKTTHGNTFG